ncbi:MAG: hypothetical protein HY720_32255 [Planctomycetes bacterium]|nr:hypothetical protein [Planctomycetota bacterium]
MLRFKPGPCPLRAVAFAALLAGLAMPARGTIVEAMTTEEMVERADLVVLGRVGSVASGIDETGERAVTDVEVSVERCPRPDPDAGPSPRTIRVRLEGGRAGDSESQIAGMPFLKSGQRVLLFLFRNEGESFYRPLGLGYGCYFCCRDPGSRRTILRRDLTGIQLVRKGAGGKFEPVEGIADRPRPLTAFLSELEKAAANCDPGSARR